MDNKKKKKNRHRNRNTANTNIENTAVQGEDKQEGAAAKTNLPENDVDSDISEVLESLNAAGQTDIRNNMDEIVTETKKEAVLEAGEEVRQEAGEETVQEAREEIIRETKEEARQEAGEESRQEARGEARQEAREEARQEVVEEARQEAVEEVRQEAREEVRQEARKEVRRGVRKEARKYIRPKRDAVKGASVMQGADMVAMAAKIAKILVPAAACIIVIVLIVSRLGAEKSKAVDSSVQGTEAESGAEWYDDNPLKENEYAAVNELMDKFYRALVDADMDTVRALKDDNSDKDIITYEKKSEFVENYEDIKCYTKSGVDADTYFVYVTYSIKVPDIETTAPGLEAWYVYTAEDGSLKIDGEVTDESVLAAWKLVTNQDDVVELYNNINLGYEEALASNEALKSFMDNIPGQISASVGEALAQLEAQGGADAAPASVETQPEGEEVTQNQAVNETVKVTDVVNVRSSDSEEADKIGKAQTGTELTRTEKRANGWSKIIFDGKEAYIKSDYLEVVSSAAVTEQEAPATPAEPEKPAAAEQQPAKAVGKVMALTNVNVRNKAGQDGDKIGTAQAGNSYDLLEETGEWFKISFNGTTGFVKAEFFQR